MKIETLVLGQLDTNCYLIYDKNGTAAIIDPADEGQYISQKILDLKLKPVMILATHGHFDHLLAATELKLVFNIPFLIHAADQKILSRTQETTRYFLGFKTDPTPIPDNFLAEGQTLTVGELKLKVISTPGHTPGSVCFHEQREQILFSGDTLFAQGIGRTDFSYSEQNTLVTSIKERLLSLPVKTTIYPGHGPASSLAKERPNIEKLLKNYRPN